MSTRTATRATHAPDPVLTVPDVMAELKVGRTAVYDLIKSKRLKTFLVGNRRRIRRSALEEYITAQERAS